MYIKLSELEEYIDRLWKQTYKAEPFKDGKTNVIEIQEEAFNKALWEIKKYLHTCSKSTLTISHLFEE